MKLGQRFLMRLKKIFVKPEKQFIDLMILEPFLIFNAVCICFRSNTWLGLLEDYHLKGIRMGCIAILVGFTWYYGAMLQIVWERKERGNRWLSVCYIVFSYGACVLLTWFYFLSYAI